MNQESRVSSSRRWVEGQTGLRALAVPGGSRRGGTAGPRTETRNCSKAWTGSQSICRSIYPRLEIYTYINCIDSMSMPRTQTAWGCICVHIHICVYTDTHTQIYILYIYVCVKLKRACLMVSWCLVFERIAASLAILVHTREFLHGSLTYRQAYRKAETSHSHAQVYWQVSQQIDIWTHAKSLGPRVLNLGTRVTCSRICI